MMNIDIDKEFNRINDLVQNGSIYEAYEELKNLIKIADAEKDKKHLAVFYYEYAFLLFNNKSYEESLKMFIAAYDLNYMEDQILKIIFECFIDPNKEEFEETYKINLQAFDSNYFGEGRILFEDLLLEFIPVTENRFFIFDKEEKAFKGILDTLDILNKAKAYPLENMQDAFSDFLFVDIWDIRKLNQYQQALKDNRIYCLTDCSERILAFLKIPGIMSNFFSEMIVFGSDEKLYEYFYKNKEVYLPRNIAVANQSRRTEINERMDKIHQYRLTPEGRADSNVLLSICIPSYNRGHRALESVYGLLNMKYDSEVEILVSDNCSDRGREEYQAISRIEDSRITYVRQERNIGYVGNLPYVLKKSKGKFALIVSDEDTVILKHLAYYLKILKDEDDCAIIRSATTFQYRGLHAVVFRAGKEAVLGFMLSNNYLSGAIYNVEMMNRYRIFEKSEKYKNNIAYKYYVHMVFDLLVSPYGKVIKDDRPLIDEGAADPHGGLSDEDKNESEKLDLLTYATFESRLQQHAAWMEIFRDVSAGDSGLMRKMYLKLCWKTIFLISLVKQKYISNGFDFNEICDQCHLEFINNFQKLFQNISNTEKKRDMLRIKVLVNQFREK